MNQQQQKKPEEEIKQRPARGCPSVWLPLTPKQKTHFLAATKGWLYDWGTEEKDWQWLENLLDKPKWSKTDEKEVLVKANRGMGFALDQLTGAAAGMTDKSVCQWTRMRLQCNNQQPAQQLDSMHQTVINTTLQSLVANMEISRSGAWLKNDLVQKEAQRLFENQRNVNQ